MHPKLSFNNKSLYSNQGFRLGSVVTTKEKLRGCLKIHSKMAPGHRLNNDFFCKALGNIDDDNNDFILTRANV